MIDLFVQASFRAPGGHFTEKSGCGALFVSARLHHLTLAPASQGPFGFGYITKLPAYSRVNNIVLKIRRPGTWWSRLLARMVRLLLSPPTRLHHLTLDPASQGPFGFGYITKLLVFSLKHENLSEDSTARHVVAPFTLAFVLPWLSHVRARRTWAPQRRGRAAGQLHGGTRHSYNHYGRRDRRP